MSVINSRPAATVQTESPNVEQLLLSWEPLVAAPRSALQLIEGMLKEYIENVFPASFNDLLLAVSTSSEANSIFAASSNFLSNILILTDALTRMPQNGNALDGLFDDEAFARELIVLTPDQTMRKITELKQTAKYSPKENPWLEHFLALLAAIRERRNFRVQFAGLQDHLQLNLKIKDCELSFDNLQCAFEKNNHAALIQLLRFITQRDEGNPEDLIPIRHFVENNRMESEEKDETSLHQSPRDFFQRTLPRQGIVINESQQIKISLLILKAIGTDFEQNMAIVTPAQLACVFVPQANLITPQQVTPFFIDNELFFQCAFGPLEGYIPLKECVGVRDNFMLALTEKFIELQKYYKSSIHRLFVFPNYNTSNVFVKEQVTEDRSSFQFKLIGIPTSNVPLTNEKKFIYHNMRLDYCFQYSIADLTSQAICIGERLQKYTEHFIKLAGALGYDQLYLRYLNNVQTPGNFIANLMTVIQQAPNFLFFCVTKHNIMNEAILAIFTILKSGFLRIKHTSFMRFVEYKLNYYEFIHYDRQTIWQVLLQHLQTYYKKPENDSQVLITHRDQRIRDYLKGLMPIIPTFFEAKQLTFDPDSDFKSDGPAAITEDVQPENAKQCILALIHELQHIPRHGYGSEIDTTMPFLPQILADSTSISPLCSSIRFHYKDQQGMDAGGMWRQTLSIMFDDLLAEKPISNDILYKIKQMNKFGRRELKFEELNKGNPNPPSLLKAINLNSYTVLVPHYNGYVCRTSSAVFPRLTDKRSCLYYFGRIVAFCLIYSGKMPNFLHKNFFKALTGGRLYFDEEVNQRYREQIQRDSMFKINGTKPLSQLYYELSPADIETFYSAYVQIWKAAQRPGVELDFLGLNQETINEIAQYGVQLQNPQHLRKYSQKALLDMQSGACFAKAYSEFRNGFRHPFATSMATPINQPDLLEMARMIDKCLEMLSPDDLEDILTFDPRNEEYMNRQTVVENMFRRNVQRIQLEIDDSVNQLAMLDRIVTAILDKEKFLHKNLLDLVFACSGTRTFTGTEITVQFIRPSATDIRNGVPIKRFIQFHTCFNQMDVPLAYVSQLTMEELSAYIIECIQAALENGFSIA